VVYVYVPGRPGERLGAGNTFTGRDVLPGFAVPVADIFAQLQQ
jgi:hypothetical protein